MRALKTISVILPMTLLLACGGGGGGGHSALPTGGGGGSPAPVGGNDGATDIVDDVNEGAGGGDSVGTPPVVFYAIETVEASIGFATSSSEMDEGDTAKLRVELSKSIPQPATVTLRGYDAGGDFTFSPNTLTFQPGETSKELDVAITDDAASESEENVAIFLEGSLPEGVVFDAVSHVITIGESDSRQSAEEEEEETSELPEDRKAGADEDRQVLEFDDGDPIDDEHVTIVFPKKQTQLSESKVVASGQSADKSRMKIKARQYGFKNNEQTFYKIKIGKKGRVDIAGENNIVVDKKLINRGSVHFVGDGDDTLTIKGNYRGAGTRYYHHTPGDKKYGRIVFESHKDADKLVVHGDLKNYFKWTWVEIPSDPGLNVPKGFVPPATIEVHGKLPVDDRDGDVATDYFDDPNTSWEHIELGVWSYGLAYDGEVDGVHKWSFHLLEENGGLHSPRTVKAAANIPSATIEAIQLLVRDAESREKVGNTPVWVRQLREDDIHFGIESPAMSLMGGDVVVGTSMRHGLSSANSVDSDVQAYDITTSWNSANGLYMDGRTRYVLFSNDVGIPDGISLVKGNEGVGMSASTELGYHFDVMGFSASPHAGLAWSRVDFEDFVAPRGERVSLEDGDLVTGHLGFLVEKDWQGLGHLYGEVNLQSALDGRTVVNVSGVSFDEKRKDLSVDGRLGVLYEWAENYAVQGQLEALHDEFRASLGLEINF